MSRGGAELSAWLKALPGTVRPAIAATIKAQAQRLAAAQRVKLARLQKPPEDSGGGMASIRVEPGSNDLTQLVLAGGELTTKDGYDHMLAFEFGTQKQPARPFFYSAARELNSSMRAAIEGAAGEAIGLRLNARTGDRRAR